MSGDLKIAFCVPTGDTVSAWWAHDYARLMTWTASVFPAVEISQLFCSGSLIPKQRNTLMKAVLEDGSFSHMLWVDTDMRFPKDALVRLLGHDAPAVGANYTRRNAPYEPVAWDAKLEPLYTEAESSGLVRAGACGFGLMLIRCADVRQMKEPYFMVGFNPQDKTWIGEDAYFCIKLSELGLPLMIDQDLSKEVTHMGRLELTYEHALRQRAAHAVQETTPA